MESRPGKEMQKHGNHSQKTCLGFGSRSAAPAGLKYLDLFPWPVS